MPCRKRQRLQHRRDANCGLTDRSVKLVLSTYMLSNYDLDLAERVGRVLLERRAKYDHRRVHQGPVPVSVWFINVPIELFDVVLLPVTDSDRHLCQDAQKLISEVRTMRWVRDENFDRGVAPASADVAMQFAQAMDGFDQGSHTEALTRSASSASRNRQRTLRQWARRFRRRWGAANANLSTLDAPPRAALGAKASGAR